MKKVIYFLFFVICSHSIFAAEWHVTTAGTAGGSGSLASPWNLQTALNHPASVLPGDIIWIHAGTYNGRFESHLIGTAANPITVSAFPNDTVIINGNTGTMPTATEFAVLEVYGGYVHFKNFEVTHLGTFSRTAPSATFYSIDGIDHYDGQDCKFINLVINNNPGIGIGSWKFTASTEIYGCLIYNNGWVQNLGGRMEHGPGLYVQNASTTGARTIKNNVVFNNYYKGCDIWSADTDSSNDTPQQFVRNVDVLENFMFNAASPYYPYNTAVKKDNLFIGTDDAVGVNRARNIKVFDNYFYHTTDYIDMNYEAPSLTIGWRPEAPVENVEVKNNFISARNNGLRFFYAKTLTFENNIVAGRYVILNPNNINSNDISNWMFKKNQYFTYNATPFRFPGPTDISFPTWQTTYTIDNFTGSDISSRSAMSALSTIGINKVIRNQYEGNKFFVVMFNKLGGANLNADFSAYGIPAGTSYEVVDSENYHATLSTGTMPAGQTISMNMLSTALEYPTDNGANNTTAVKTATNFGVFLVEFDPCQMIANVPVTGEFSACTGVGLDNQTTNSIALPAGYSAQWSINYGAGTFVGPSNGTSATINWSVLPGYMTVTIKGPNGCATTKDFTIVDQCKCDCLNTEYLTSNVSGLTATLHVMNTNPACSIFGIGSWYWGDGTYNYTGNSNPSHTYAAAGTYTVTITRAIKGMYDEPLCSGPQLSTNVTVTNNGGIKGGRYAFDNDITISPNPTSSNLSINLNLLAKEEVKVVIRGIDGKELMTRSWNLSQGKQTLDFSLPNSISDGTVFVELSYRDFKTVKTVLIKK